MPLEKRRSGQGAHIVQWCRCKERVIISRGGIAIVCAGCCCTAPLPLPSTIILPLATMNSPERSQSVPQGHWVRVLRPVDGVQGAMKRCAHGRAHMALHDRTCSQQHGPLPVTSLNTLELRPHEFLTFWSSQDKQRRSGRIAGC